MGTGNIIIEDVDSSKKEPVQFSSVIRSPEQFKALNHVIMRDLNSGRDRVTLHAHRKDEILKYLKQPAQYEKELRDACTEIYAASPHFRRLISYFTMLTDLAYIVTPTTTTKTQNAERMKTNFKRVLTVMENMQVSTQLRKIIRICLREDVFYGTLWVTNDNITIQQLPSDFCRISAIEGNVFNVTFDFSYFDQRPDRLPAFPEEFELKYRTIYKKNTANRWIELDAPYSFAIKATNDIGAYALPPFAGILPEVYDLDDYKALKLTRTEMENYAILVMKLGLNSDGSWALDFDRAVDFWSNLDDILPDAVGSVLSPMPVDKISFDRSSTPQADTIEEATNNMFSAAGVSTLLFNSDKASSNALLLSIKADQAITYEIVKSIEDALNRFIQSTSYGKFFRVEFLNTSVYNRDEVGGQYLKMVTYGMPMVSHLAATYGMTQGTMMNLNYLEDDLLGIKSKFVPLQNSATMSGNAAQSGEAGRPSAGVGEISDNGEIAQERDEG